MLWFYRKRSKPSVGSNAVLGRCVFGCSSTRKRYYWNGPGACRDDWQVTFCLENSRNDYCSKIVRKTGIAWTVFCHDFAGMFPWEIWRGSDSNMMRISCWPTCCIISQPSWWWWEWPSPRSGRRSADCWASPTSGWPIVQRSTICWIRSATW